MKPDSFDELAKYVPEQHLAEFWRMVSRLRQLRPDDEILNIFQAMGVMTFILRDLPSDLIAEREEWKTQLDTFRGEMSQMVEGVATQAVTVTNHAEVLNDAMVKNGLMIRECATLIQQSSQEAVKQIDVDSISDKVSTRIEERIVTRLDGIITRAEHILDVLDQVASECLRAVKAWKKATVWPLVGGISAGILGLCLTLTGLGLKIFYDADQVALQTKLAEVQGMAETNKTAFALLAQNQIALEVAGVRGDSGQTLSGLKALNLTPASEVRLETAPDQSKRAVIFISVPQTSPGIFPPWRVGP
jgi:polyhydroxyalkanoate synthesis regulator phasin